MNTKEKIIAEIERLMNWKPKAIPSGMRQRDVLNIRKGVLLTLKAFINSLPAEQPSEDLKEAAKDFVEKNSPYTDEFMLDNEVEEAYKIAELTFKRGAQWQKEQMMKGLCYKTKVYRDEEGDGIDTPIESWLALENNEITNLPNIGLKDGDKVKVIIVKEDE